jgi:hypothetical protein
VVIDGVAAVALAVEGMLASEPADSRPAMTLELRLRSIRKRRFASRLSEVRLWAVWITVLAGLTIVGGAGFLTFR